LLETGSENYPFIAFNYIHQNPLHHKIADRLEDWEYSSFKDYAGLRMAICAIKNWQRS